MTRLGLPTTCIEARKAHKSLSARLNKSDAAEGLAQLARTNWFTPVHIRSEEATGCAAWSARARLVRLRKDLEGHIRSVLKTFGIRMTGIGQGRQRQAFRDQLAAAGETDPVIRTIMDGFITANATLCQVADDLDKAVNRQAKAHPVARRLMTILGVGPVNALSFVALVEDPNRFCRASDVGAFPGLTPKRYRSGKIDWSGGGQNAETGRCADCCSRRRPASSARSSGSQGNRTSTVPTGCSRNAFSKTHFAGSHTAHCPFSYHLRRWRFIGKSCQR